MSASRDARASGKDWLLVSMYTENYADRAEALRRSCVEHGVPHRLELISASDYQRAVNFAVRFMLEMLQQHRGPIVYTDADFVVKQYPALFDNPDGVDFMIYNWYADPENTWYQHVDRRLLLSSGGVIYWNYTPPALRLLKEWCATSEANPRCAGDQLLDRIFNEGRQAERLKYAWLPRSYLRLAQSFPETSPVLDHADHPGANAPPWDDARTARRPLFWRIDSRVRRWLGRISPGGR